MTDIAYLDHNATTPARPEVAQAVADAMMMTGANPSSVHAYGRAALKRVEAARADIARLAGTEPDNVVFTGGGSEANNTVILGAGRRRVLVSATEHSAVLKTALVRAADADVIPVDDQGVVHLVALADLLAQSDEPALVCVMAANNETGTLQPIPEIVKIAHDAGALVHCDAVQAAGKVVVDFTAWGVDFMALTGHKIGGPQGIGAIFKRPGLALRSLITGGGQERGARAGTENVAAIVGFGVAAQLVAENLETSAPRMAEFRDALEAQIKELSLATMIFSADAPRLPNTSNFSLPGVRSDTQVMSLDLAGVAVSAGSACSAGKLEPSHVLDAMGVAPDISTTALRVSFGWNSEAGDVDKFIEAWKGLIPERAETAA
ncbi:MAG: cysteine desulfurase [Rhodospirillaceae bacterium]|nr:cysteine desulfurase [Rhodospirillaceae bacterium]